MSIGSACTCPASTMAVVSTVHKPPRRRRLNFVYNVCICIPYSLLLVFDHNIALDLMSLSPGVDCLSVPSGSVPAEYSRCMPEFQNDEIPCIDRGMTQILGERWSGHNISTMRLWSHG